MSALTSTLKKIYKPNSIRLGDKRQPSNIYTEIDDRTKKLNFLNFSYKYILSV